MTVLSAASRSYRPLSRSEKWFRNLFQKAFEGLKEGQIHLQDGDGSVMLGTANKGKPVHLQIFDGAAYREILLEGSVGAGRSYANGLWKTSDLPRLLSLAAGHEAALKKLRSGWSLPATLGMRLISIAQRNTRRGSRKNIAAHYDLGNQFFQTFLDKHMMYSSALYAPHHSSLEEASEYKLQRLCEKLDLGSKDHLLEIGTGWGGLAIYAAQHYGCRVTTTTISPSQHRYAQERVAQSHLGDRVSVIQKDYRDLSGSFTKIVSVEMIEAVGREFIDGYFSVMNRLLTPGGRIVLQAIVIDDDEFERAARSVDFIKRYIFPGSCIPSRRRIAEAVQGSTNVQPDGVEDLTQSYVRTLAAWRSRFLGAKEQILQMGFSKEFIRLWDFYFSYCQGG
ncbi:MAG: class I SAM-dependent methyltransferase, partial [Candidatus Eisenbacteria bacterium]|nr:class I SAM-dependent methyltransferase [Candidatus Eisenbacteria bacterium]